MTIVIQGSRHDAFRWVQGSEVSFGVGWAMDLEQFARRTKGNPRLLEAGVARREGNDPQAFYQTAVIDPTQECLDSWVGSGAEVRTCTFDEFAESLRTHRIVVHLSHCVCDCVQFGDQMVDAESILEVIPDNRELMIDFASCSGEFVGLTAKRRPRIVVQYVEDRVPLDEWTALYAAVAEQVATGRQSYPSAFRAVAIEFERAIREEWEVCLES